MHADARNRLHAAIERKNAERGRPLTACEKLDNLSRWLWPASGMSAFGQDREAGLEAKPASPVGEAETPNPSGQEGA